MTDQQRGATLDEWQHFDMVLGLGANLLPCVPAAPDVKVLPGSALEGKIGKIPSQFNHAGEAHGIKGWQKREIMSNEVVAWSKDRRLNLCVRTGPISGVYAFDIDVEDPQTSDAIFNLIVDAIAETKQNVSFRARENSRKCLIPFRMEEPCKKRRIKLDNNPKGPALELLADGQQFVACGSHSSGSRYQWLPGLPEALPTLTLEQVDQIWATLTKTYATTDSKKDNPTALAQATQATTQTPQSGTGSGSTEYSTLFQCTDEEWQQLIETLRFLTDKVSDNDSWSEVGYALLSLQSTRPAQQLWIDFSKKAAGYEEGAPEAWWDAHANQTPRSDFRHIFKMARARGYSRVADPSLFAPVESYDDLVGGDEGPAPTADAISVVPDAPTKPIIQVGSLTFSEIVDRLERVMVPHMYVQGPHLVFQTKGNTEQDIRRTSDSVMLTQVSKEWLYNQIDKLTTWQKFLAKTSSWITIEPVEKYIQNLYNLRDWPHLQPLDALARAPFVRADGSICDTPGYDRRSRVLYVPSTDFPPISENPSQHQASEALERIRSVFDQFPWKEPASESAFVCHILSEAARVAIDTCPMFFYDAPSAGTGKTLLQEMAARIVHGSNPAMRAWVGDGDEVRKSLYAAVLAGDRSLWFDNLPDGHKTRSAELCAFLTSSTWTDRKLGESQSLCVPNKIVVVASGNNVTPTGDLARRSLVVRMDANTSRLKERVFRIPLLREYVMENRPQLLVDALTIIKAFNLQNPIQDPEKRKRFPVPLQSFERWSHFCRNPLIWLGLEDPVITQNETDDESGSIGNVYVALAQHFGDRKFTSVDVARLVNSIMDSNGDLANEMIINGCKEPNNPVKVGYWLRGYRDRISNGYKLTHGNKQGVGVRWQLIKVDEELT